MMQAEPSKEDVIILPPPPPRARLPAVDNKGDVFIPVQKKEPRDRFGPFATLTIAFLLVLLFACNMIIYDLNKELAARKQEARDVALFVHQQWSKYKDEL
jgi:hypothetical protein